jgi:hypothetical protein
MHPDAPPAERQRNPAGTDPEFQSGPCAGQPSKEVYGRVDHRAIEQLRPKDLVPLSDPVIEVGFWHTPSMPSSDSVRQPS